MKEKLAIFFFVILFFTGANIFHVAYAATSEDCGLYHLSFECDLSGWMKLVLGDLAIAATLALLLHFLAHRSNLKIEENTRITKENSKNIQKIIVAQEEARNRRKIYVVQTLKNHLSSILLGIGLMNQLLKSGDDDKTSKINQNEFELKNITSRARGTLDLSIDIFDPLLVDQIEKFLSTLESTNYKKSDLTEFPNYPSIKETIKQISTRLSESLDSDEVLK